MTYTILFALVHTVLTSSGAPEEQETLNRAVENWGTQKHERVQKALEKAESIPITIEAGLTDRVEDIREAYKVLARVLPVHVLMGPESVHIIPGGGYYDGQEKDPKGEERKSTIAIESLAINREGFFRSALHELSHAEINWLDGKTFVNRKEFAEYLTIQLRAIKTTMDEYFSLPWDLARLYKNGKEPLVMRYPGDWGLETIYELEGRLAKGSGLNINQLAPLDKEELLDESLRFNRLLWRIGATQRSIMAKPEDQRSQQEKSFISYNLIAYDGLKRVYGELDHYFRGPVQREGLGLPGRNIPPENSDPLTLRNRDIQMARLRSMSALPPERLTDFTTASQALRDAFGLDEHPPLVR